MRGKNIKWMPVLMVITILAIAGVQVYWLSKAYEREARTLEMRTNFLFRETIHGIQASKLKLDSLAPSETAENAQRFLHRELVDRKHSRVLPKDKMIGMADVLMQHRNELSNSKIVFENGDSIRVFNNRISPRQNRIMQFLFDVDALQDSIRVAEIEKVYIKKLAEQNLADVPFAVRRVPTNEREPDTPRFNEVTLGFANPATYRLDLGDTFPVLFKRISAATIFSVILVALTFFSFMLLYRNLLRQRKLADIKNEFISNITHELKTPIATVSVAIEALRSFGASVSTQKTKEYLDISANELQRLSMLVDKVLKLSMFEKKEIELKYEPLSMQQLVDEVTASMRLQFEKKGAVVNIHSDGEACLEGDRLHLVSVLFNLLDNALKYSNGSPRIDISIYDKGPQLQLIVADNGLGISPEYHHRIFEKFFRVPHGNVHDAKGYGLGLSYVSHVIKRHNGSIAVDSTEGQGSRFLITLPKHHSTTRLRSLSKAVLSS